MQAKKILIVALSLVLFNLQAQECNIVTGISSNFPPHHYRTDDGRWTGLSLDMFAALTKEAGCGFEIIEAPWDRALELLESGQLDTLHNVTKTPKRSEFARFVGPHFTEVAVIVANRELSKDLNTLQDFSRFNGLIGKTQGTNIGREAENILLNNKALQYRMVWVKNNEVRVSMLVNNRINAMIEDQATANLLFKQGKLDNNKFRMLTIAVNPVYFAFSNKSISTKRYQKLQQAWLTLLENGTVKTLYRKYDMEYLPYSGD